jgi:hypothetical protein
MRFPDEDPMQHHNVGTTCLERGWKARKDEGDKKMKGTKKTTFELTATTEVPLC